MSPAPDTPPPAERRAALERRFAPWRARTIDERFADAVEEFDQRPYVITDARSTSFAEVLERTLVLADGLAAFGVEPGDHVAILMANLPEYAALKFAIARVGAVAVPLNFLYKTAELGYVLKQSRTSLLITMTSFRGWDYMAMLDELAPGWERREGRTGFGDLRTVITVSPEGDPREGVPDLAELERRGLEAPGGARGGRRRPDDPSDIMYTSGTTGHPKGVVLTHDALQRCAYGSVYCRALGDGNRVLSALPLYHMFGYEQALQSCIFDGGAMVPHARFDPVEHFRAIERHRVEDVLCVPTMSVALVEHPARDEFDLSSLIRMLSASTVSPIWLWESIRSELGVTELTTAYGMTEVGGGTTMTKPEDPVEITASTVGKPKPSGAAGIPELGGVLIEYYVADPETGERVGVGEVGELVSRGPTTMLGYWDRPDETGAALRGERMHSGDLGRILEDGSVVLTGRSKDLYKSGGELVMPKEIEDFLTAQPGVSQAYVVGVPDERWGEVGCAFVVPETPGAVDPEELIESCRGRLARFKVPRHVVQLSAAELPQTASGKVQKVNLIPLARELLDPTTSNQRSQGD
jgi:fatty-acyl-CoA synthase